MPRYSATVTTAWSREEAFGYLADFSSVSDWDPSIPRAELKSGSALRRGSLYEVDFELLGRITTLTYETIEIQRPSRVSLRAETASMVSLDTMSFEEHGNGASVTYEAQITLKGTAKLATPLLALSLRRFGSKAEQGLRGRLAGHPPTRPAGKA